MLLAILIAAIYIALLKIIENPIIKKIQDGKDLNEILYQRKKLRKVRKVSLVIILIICFSLYLIQKFIYNVDWFDMDLIKSLVLSIAFSLIVVKQRKDHNPLGIMSALSKEDVFNRNKDYILFLRGFEQDDYTPEIKISRWKQNFEKFSEFYFTSTLKKCIKVYAVGMTKEIEAPTGAERVYLSDKNWKQDVLDLMVNARLIVVLVDDRESCIWEIERSTDMLDKTLFVVDDKNKYLNILHKVKINFPQTDANIDVPFMLSLANGRKTKLYKFYNTKKSYQKVVDIILKQYLHNEYKIPFRKKIIGKCLIYYGVFCLSGILSSLLSGLLGDGDNNVYYFFGSFFILLGLGIYVCQQKIFK